MHPSPKVVDRGTPLTLDQFQSEFQQAWSSLRSRFLKVECWQSYQELATNRSQEHYRKGDLGRARELLREEAEGDRPLYEDVSKRGLDFARIRVVKEPLTDYLRYELMSYQIRTEMGENVVVVTADPEVQLPNSELFDLLLFDRDVALVHDYGTADVGSQTGGWLVRDPALIDELEHNALALRERSIPLRRYLETPMPDHSS